MVIWRRILVALSLLSVALPALAVEFRSIGVPAAILYDAPSQKAKKLYLIKAMTPIEVVVSLEGWIKVRDAEGTLAWIESNQLSDQRMLVVTADTAEIRKADNDSAPVVAELAKGVAVEFLGPAATGWAKVRHRDGAVGYIRSTQVWGL